MVAGGPTPSADIDRTIVKRASQPYRSAEETRQAVRSGLTLDQFGFNPGDELVIGRQPSIISPYINAFVGLTAVVPIVSIGHHALSARIVARKVCRLVCGTTSNVHVVDPLVAGGASVAPGLI